MKIRREKTICTGVEKVWNVQLQGLYLGIKMQVVKTQTKLVATAKTDQNR